MVLKWGSTTVTAVKWGSTNCTAVYWGGTKVFPDGILDKFDLIFTGNTNSPSSSTWKASSPTTGIHYRNSTKGTSVNLATLSGNTHYVHSDYYTRSENYYNKLNGGTLKATSSAISISNKKVSYNFTVSGYSTSNGLLGTRGWYATSKPTVSGSKISGCTSLAGINISGMNNIKGNGTFTVTSTTTLNGNYYLLLGFGASVSNSGTYPAGTASMTCVVNSVTLV